MRGCATCGFEWPMGWYEDVYSLMDLHGEGVVSYGDAHQVVVVLCTRCGARGEVAVLPSAAGGTEARAKR